MSSSIVIVGTGPGPLSWVTREAESLLLSADKVFFRMSSLPIYRWLEERGKQLVCFDPLYRMPGRTNVEIYDFIAEAIVQEARVQGRAVFALPGNPWVFEQTTRLICRRARAEGIPVEVVPGISFLELMYGHLEIDPAAGVQVVSPGALRPATATYTDKLGLLIGLLGAPAGPEPTCDTPSVTYVSRWLLEKYPPDHPVSLVWTTGMPDYETHSETFALGDLVDKCGDGNFFASLYVPPRGDDSGSK